MFQCSLLRVLLLCLTAHSTLVTALPTTRAFSMRSVCLHLRKSGQSTTNNEDDGRENRIGAAQSSLTLKLNPFYTSLAAAETVFWYWLAPGIDPNSRWFAPSDGALIAKLLDPSIVLTEPGYAFSSLLLNSFLIVPVVWALLLLQEDEQLVPPLPFCLAGFVVGGGALMPYMIVRRPKENVDPSNFPLALNLFETRNIGSVVLATISAVILVTFAVEICHSSWTVEWDIFVDRLMHSQFTSLALFDFIMISCTIIDPMIDDAKRRGYLKRRATSQDAARELALFLMPLIGPVSWIVRRPKYGHGGFDDGIAT